MTKISEKKKKKNYDKTNFVVQTFQKKLIKIIFAESSWKRKLNKRKKNRLRLFKTEIVKF